MNKRICKKRAKRNWLRLQQEMADPVAFWQRNTGLFWDGVPSPGWQKQALWIGREGQESEATS